MQMNIYCDKEPSLRMTNDSALKLKASLIMKLRVSIYIYGFIDGTNGNLLLCNNVLDRLLSYAFDVFTRGFNVIKVK